MTTNLHDKMLAAIDALFSASDGDERDQAEKQLLDVRDELRKHKLAEQEPIKWADYEPDGMRHNKPSQPSNPKKWLTREEEQEIKNNCTTVSCVLKAVKAKLSTTPQPPRASGTLAQPLTDEVRVPLEVLEAAESSLGSFCSDEGWGDQDMQNMDNLSAYIAQHKAAHGITKGNT